MMKKEGKKAGTGGERIQVGMRLTIILWRIVKEH